MFEQHRAGVFLFRHPCPHDDGDDGDDDSVPNPPKKQNYPLGRPCRLGRKDGESSKALAQRVADATTWLVGAGVPYYQDTLGIARTYTVCMCESGALDKKG